MAVRIAAINNASKSKIDAVWEKTLKERKKHSKRKKTQKNSHTGRHNTDNSLRTKERDGSNRYNNSDTNREHDRHSR